MLGLQVDVISAVEAADITILAQVNTHTPNKVDEALYAASREGLIATVKALLDKESLDTH